MELDFMYETSDGAKIKLSDMHYEHLVNALSKAQREIFNVNTLEDFNKKLETINRLEVEIENRIGVFLNSKLDNKEW